MDCRSDSNTVVLSFCHSSTLCSVIPMPQAQLEAGVTFKKSTAKGEAELDFVPVNLHIQQMKVKMDGTQERGGC